MKTETIKTIRGGIGYMQDTSVSFIGEREAHNLYKDNEGYHEPAGENGIYTELYRKDGEKEPRVFISVYNSSIPGRFGYSGYLNTNIDGTDRITPESLLDALHEGNRAVLRARTSNIGRGTRTELLPKELPGDIMITNGNESLRVPIREGDTVELRDDDHGNFLFRMDVKSPDLNFEEFSNDLINLFKAKDQIERELERDLSVDLWAAEQLAEEQARKEREEKRRRELEELEMRQRTQENDDREYEDEYECDIDF